jgi:hypothetical protein
MRRWLPIAILLISALVHSLLLRQLVDTLLFGLFGSVPLLLIYFGDEMGSATGYWLKGEYIDEPTPGIFVQVFGWILLLGLCIPLLAGVPFNPRGF